MDTGICGAGAILFINISHYYSLEYAAGMETNNKAEFYALSILIKNAIEFYALSDAETN